jgi:hypothetical protein
MEVVEQEDKIHYQMGGTVDQALLFLDYIIKVNDE